MVQAASAQELSAIFQLLRAGDAPAAFQRAQRLVRQSPQWAAAVHLLGLAARDLGNLSEAEDYMRRSLAMAGVAGRERAEYANNLANLLRGSGYHAQAEALYRDALAHHDLPQSRVGLARVLLDMDQAEAAVVLLRALPAAHRNLTSRLLLSEALAHSGQRQAALDELLARAEGMPAEDSRFALMLASRLMAVGRFEEAQAKLNPLFATPAAISAYLAGVDLRLLLRDWEAARALLAEGVARFPDEAPLLTRYSAVLWMLGDSRYFADELRAALARRPQDRALRLGLASLLRNAGHLEEALSLLEHDLDQLGKDGERWAVMAGVALDLERMETAERAVRAALASAPEHELVRERAALHALATGAAEEALSHTAWMINARPLGQMGWALRVLALRLANRDEWRRIADPAQVCGTARVEPPAGYGSFASFNAALAASLRRLHTLQAHPLVNSVREGTQIEIEPETERDPVIRAFFAAIQPAIAGYIQSMPAHATHPLFARRQRGYRLNGCWSVRLSGSGGHHVNHVHPRGWISSAYYVEVPPQIPASGERAGWLGFGGAPLPDARTDPSLRSTAWVRPEVGTLALFPSYQWHGVAPFPGVGERLTLAFDILPTGGAVDA